MMQHKNVTQYNSLNDLENSSYGYFHCPIYERLWLRAGYSYQGWNFNVTGMQISFKDGEEDSI